MLNAQQVSFKIAGKLLLNETSLLFQPGKFHVIMGANGAGKSTLMKLLAGDLHPSSGEILWNGQWLHTLSKKQLARRRAVLSQHYHISFPVSVQEVVMMGRYPFFHVHPLQQDINIAKQAMQLMDVYSLHERDYNTLSGGEAQKVQMSRVLAQIWEDQDLKEKMLLLDEPVSHLDVKYQHQLLTAAKNLCANGVTVIAILHDINLAIAFADRLIFLKKGQMLFETDQLKDVTTELIKEVFDINSTILYPTAHKPVVIF